MQIDTSVKSLKEIVMEQLVEDKEWELALNDRAAIAAQQHYDEETEFISRAQQEREARQEDRRLQKKRSRFVRFAELEAAESDGEDSDEVCSVQSFKQSNGYKRRRL